MASDEMKLGVPLGALGDRQGVEGWMMCCPAGGNVESGLDM